MRVGGKAGERNNASHWKERRKEKERKGKERKIVGKKLLERRAGDTAYCYEGDSIFP
jgi:hypothetical protein